MKVFPNRRIALLAGGACVALTSMPAVAQDADGNDIIVTATRRPQTLLDVPLSVAVVSGADLDKMGTRQFNDLQGSVPNLQIDQTNGNFVINMRGLGSGGGNLAFEQSVGFFVDGVYSGRSRSLQTAMMDVARVEVVRGPQGALFGKNTDAGAISVITAAPTHDFQGRVSAGYEFENQGWNAEGYLSGPITDTLTARLSAQGGHAGGYMYNRATKTDDNSNDYLGIRGQLLFEPMKGMSAKLKIEYGKNNYNGNNLAYNGLGTSAVADAIRAIDAPYGGAIETPSFTRIQSTPYGRGFSRTESWNVTLTTDTDLGGGVKLTTITGYQHIKARTSTDIDVSPLTLIDNLHTEGTTQLSEEARVSASIGKLSLIAGLQYYYAKSHIVQNVYWNNPGLPLALLTGATVLPFEQKSESVSPFLAGNLEILPGLTIDGSVRYSDERKQARMQLLPGGPSIYPLYDIHARRHEKLWDYSGKASYKFSARGQIYVSYATGSKGGGFVANDSTLGRPNSVYQFNPERARSWETGLKLRGEGGRYDLNLALFNTNFDNLQVSSYNGVSFVTGNAAKVRSRGIELEGDLRPVSFFSVGGNVALLDAKYQSYHGPCIYNQTCPLGYSDLSGYRLTRAPKWKWTAYAQVDTPLNDALQFTARGQVNYTGLTNYQDTQNPVTMMPAYTTVDARVAVSNKAQGWDVALVGRNLTNAISWSQAFGLPEIAGATGVFINPGRTITLQVSKNF